MISRLRRNKWKPYAITVGTAIISAAITYGLWNQPLALLSIQMLIAHEYGHYFAGHFAGSTVSPPFFIPFGYITVGATRIKNIDKKYAARIAASGPIYGSLTAILAALLLVTFAKEALIPGILVLFAYEIGWGIIGGDGRKYRAAKAGV